jgi:hypothetical protein
MKTKNINLIGIVEHKHTGKENVDIMLLDKQKYIDSLNFCKELKYDVVRDHRIKNFTVVITYLKDRRIMDYRCDYTVNGCGLEFEGSSITHGIWLDKRGLADVAKQTRTADEYFDYIVDCYLEDIISTADKTAKKLSSLITKHDNEGAINSALQEYSRKLMQQNNRKYQIDKIIKQLYTIGFNRKQLKEYLNNRSEERRFQKRLKKWDRKLWKL